jgi:hypothetical protein
LEKGYKHKIRKQIQIKLCKAPVALVFMYGTENWALNRSDRKKIETAEILFLRHVPGNVLNRPCMECGIHNALQIWGQAVA